MYPLCIMKTCEIKISKLQPDAQLPVYAHGPDEDAGMDLRAIAGTVLQPGVPQAVPTGLRDRGSARDTKRRCDLEAVLP